MRGATVLGFVLAIAGIALTGASVRAAEDPTKTLLDTLHKRYPDIKLESAQPTAIPGLYEVFAGGRVVYTDATGDYMILGKLVDTRTRHDLSAEHLDAHMAIEFDKLPFDRAIKFVKGNGSHRLAVFEDPDCPYCQQMEKDMVNLKDVTIYVFLYPLETVHPNATAHAHAIWCSPDRAAAWTGWVIDRKQPTGTKCDGDPVDDLQTLGTNLRISSTPTLFFESGRRIGGAIDLNTLQQLISTGGKPPQPPTVGATAPAEPGAPVSSHRPT